MSKIIKIPKKDVMYEIARGWASPDDVGFKVFADERGASRRDQDRWVIYEEGAKDDRLLRKPYLRGEVSWEDLLAVAEHALSWGFQVDGEFLVLCVRELWDKIGEELMDAWETSPPRERPATKPED